MIIEEYVEHFSGLITEECSEIDLKLRRLYELGMIKSVSHFIQFASKEFDISEDKITDLFMDYIEDQVK